MEQGQLNTGKGVLCGPKNVEGSATVANQRFVENVQPTIVTEQAQRNKIPGSEQVNHQVKPAHTSNMQNVGSVVHFLPQHPQPYNNALVDQVEVGFLDVALVNKLKRHFQVVAKPQSVLKNVSQVCSPVVKKVVGFANSVASGVPVAESGRGRQQGGGRGRGVGRQAQILQWYMDRQDGLISEPELSGSEFDVAMGRSSLEAQFQETFMQDTLNEGLPGNIPQQQQVPVDNPSIEQVVQSQVVDTLSGMLSDLGLGNLSSDTQSGEIDTGVEPTFGVLNQPVYQVHGVPVGEGMGGAGAGPSLQPREVKIQKPATFDGKHADLDNFVFEMKQYIDTVGLGTGSRACRFLVSYLKGDAMTWWRTFALSRRSGSTSVFDNLDLDTLVHELEQQFSDIDKKMRIRTKLMKLSQTDRVQFYTATFRRLQVELGDERLDENTAQHCYISGLKPAIRQQVLLQRPQTFEDCVLLAERASQAIEIAGGNQYRQQYNRGGFGGNRNFRGNGRSFHNNQYRGRHGGNNFRGNGNFRGGFSGNRGGMSQYSDHPYKGDAPMALGNVEQRSGVQCHYCNKFGHIKKDCWKYQREHGVSGGDNKQQKQQLNTVDVAKQLAAILNKQPAQQQQQQQKGGNGGQPKN